MFAWRVLSVCVMSGCSKLIHEAGRAWELMVCSSWQLREDLRRAEEEVTGLGLAMEKLEREMEDREKRAEEVADREREAAVASAVSACEARERK